MRWVFCVTILAAALPARADAPKPNTLTPQEAADGWLLLFDGATTFGWMVEGDAKVKDGKLILGAKTKALPTIPPCPSSEGLVEYRTEGSTSFILRCGAENHWCSPAGANAMKFRFQVPPPDKLSLSVEVERLSPTIEASIRHTDLQPTIDFYVDPNGMLSISRFKYRPLNLKPLFNGKDLVGWKKFDGDLKRANSEFAVTKDGWLHVKNGPGDLQTVDQFDDFLLQLECKTNGKGLNSGVFFRCLPGQYQNGYEAQVHNVFKDGDRAKPADFGTGAIYRRVPARKVVADDNEWFTMTVLARGNRITTWVNGHMTVDWTDERPPHENPRNGSKTGKGHLSLQGHDPTTDLYFRNIRIAELKR